MILQKKSEEVITLVVGKRTEVEEGEKTVISKEQVRDIGKEVQVKEEVEDVIGGTGRIAALQDAGAETKSVPQISDVEDVDDSTLLNKEIEKVIAFATIDTADLDNCNKQSPNVNDIKDSTDELQIDEEIGDVIASVGNIAALQDSGT